MKSLYMALVVVLFVSCNNSDDGFSTKDYTEENELEIQEYVSSNGLDATRTDSGLYYVIDEVGEGAAITGTSDISVRYLGTLTDGTEFANSEGNVSSFNIQSVIYGWQEGLQFFNEGGSGTLIIPAHLAYGSNDYNEIPGGSVLVFDIEVVDYNVENRQEILDYIATNNLEAQETASGLFYVIEEQGTGDKPLETSNVSVTYTGSFTDGEVFDEATSDVTFNVDQVIEGWQEGIQLLNEGGSMKLLIPSALGYGRFGNASIPGGSVLVFDVNLNAVN